jgi:3-hydroxyisobutyrate dehydrogenase-like beta-hydroxyacid dehydrogenase
VVTSTKTVTNMLFLCSRARAAELTIIKAGDKKLRKVVDPYLIPALGKKSIELGEDVSEALNMKLTGNCMITGFAEVVAEGLTLAAATGKI